jgi:hypothetical protein
MGSEHGYRTYKGSKTRKRSKKKRDYDLKKNSKKESSYGSICLFASIQDSSIYRVLIYRVTQLYRRLFKGQSEA